MDVITLSLPTFITNNLQEWLNTPDVNIKKSLLRQLKLRAVIQEGNRANIFAARIYLSSLPVG
jgi:hypothetical protein